VKPERSRFPYLAHGVLFVPEDYRQLLLNGLSQARNKSLYRQEIHYTRIAGHKGRQFQVAREWLHVYLTAALLYCPFKAFIVEQEGIRLFPYAGEEGYPAHSAHALLSTFVGGIAWSYSRAPSVNLRPVFDNTDNDLDRRQAFDLPNALEAEVSLRRAVAGKPYPVIKVMPTSFVESNPLAAGDSWGDSELVQLCDLLLGAAMDSLESAGRSPKTGRLQLSRSVAQVMTETLKVPAAQHMPVHRRFSVSLYPDEFNLAYPAALKRTPRQPEGEQLGLFC
jgi:hypothetical protein